MSTLQYIEYNGVSPGTQTQLTNANYGSIDAANLDPVANPITPGQNSFEKWQRWHLVSLDGASAVDQFRFYATAPASGWTQFFNGHTVQGTYAGANHVQTSYSQPVTTRTRTPESVPTSDPGVANIGIGGLLAGQLTTAPGDSDFLVNQIVAGSGVTSGGTLTVTFARREVA